MSRLRSTGTFSPVGSDAGTSNDSDSASLAREAARLRRDVPWLDDDIDVNGGLSATRDGTFGGATGGDLPDSPSRQTLVPARRGTGASLRPVSQSSQRPALSPPSLSNEARRAEEVSFMTRRELTARANEIFDGLINAVQQLVSTLSAFDEDKTPTQNPKNPSRLRDAIRTKTTELGKVVQVADVDRSKPSCLTVLQHRQMREFSECLEAFERRISDRQRPEPKVFTPEEALLNRLQRALAMQQKRLG